MRGYQKPTPRPGVTMLKTLCTLAALAIAVLSFGNAFGEAQKPQVDEVITGSITPATYGLKYNKQQGGY